MKNGGRITGMLMVLAMVAGALLFLGVSVAEFSQRGMEFTIMAILGEALIFSMLMFGPVGRAIAGLLEGHSTPDPMDGHRLTDVEDRLTEISGEMQRITELEARLEFTERLLAAPTGQYRKLGEGS